MPSSFGPDAEAGDDVSTLAWVQGELRRSLDNAHKALRRYVKEAEALGGSDVDAVDPAVLRSARAQLHQSVGALELVGLPVVAQVLRASEAAVQRFIARPKLAVPAAVEAIERVSFAVLDYVGRMLAGRTPPPLALYPQYAAAQAVAGAERIHPADLWAHDWQWRQLPPETAAPARRPDDAARSEMEGLALALMRQAEPAAQRRACELCAELSAGASGELATLWQLASAFFEGQAQGLITPDVHTKRVASRLLALLRSAMRGEPDVPDRLAQDLLFFCVRAQLPDGAAAATPRLARVQSVWPADAAAQADYATPRLGLFDPGVIQQARRRVVAAKDVWSALAGGELQRAGGLNEAFTLLADSLQRLFPGGPALAAALQAAAEPFASGERQPPAALAMEIATSVLYLDAVLEDGELDQPVLGERITRLAQRVQDVAAGSAAQPLEQWMEELYRRISDRQTMGSVVQELRSSLSEIEKQIDQYFRDPSRRELLIPVPAQLSSIRSVLSVLGMDQASHAVLRMRDDVDALAQTEVDPQRAVQTGTFDRLADNLGALSFLIDMLSVQPQMAKSLFRFDPETGNLSAVMGQSERTSAFATFEATALESDTPPATAPGTLQAAPAPVPAPAAAPVQASGLEDDAEMREIFLEEAREVLQDAAASLQRLAQMPDDVAEMTSLRRAFHTLKGSSRMVGLTEFGEAGWSCEQLFNARLAQNARMEPALLGFTTEALQYLGAWVQAIADGVNAGHNAAAVSRAADALRNDGTLLPIAAAEAPAEAKVEAAPPVSAEPLADAPADVPAAEAFGSLPDVVIEDAGEINFGETAEPAFDGALEAHPEAAAEQTQPIPTLHTLVPDLPSAADLELPTLVDDEPRPVPAEAEIHFDLDLAALEEAAEAPTITDLPPPGALEPAAEDAAALPAESAPTDVLEMSLDDFDAMFEAPAAASAETAETSETAESAEPPPAAAALPEPEPQPEPEPAVAEEDPVKIVGPLRIAIPLFNIFLNEADEQSRRLSTELAEWTLEHHRPITESAIALAHSLAGNSATVGFTDLSTLARSLEHALMRSRGIGHGSDGEPELFGDAAEEIRRLLHQFAAGFLKPVNAELLDRLAEHERVLSPQAMDTSPAALDNDAEALPPPPAPPRSVAAVASAADDDDEIDAVDAIDPDLFPIFDEEADELMPQLRGRLADWMRHPSDDGAASACMRTLHTFKGGARLAGAMRVGEMAHRLETEIEALASRDEVLAADVERLLARADAMAVALEGLRKPAAVSAPEAAAPALAPAPAAPVEAEPVDLTALLEGDADAVAPAGAELPHETAPAPDTAAPDAAAPPAGPTTVAIDWSRFANAVEHDASEAAAETASASSSATVRVRAPLLDRLVNQAGEVSITRARIESDMQAMQGSLEDLTENLNRLRHQLRDIELQAETQITSRMEAAKAASQSFDPLEMDRFTRFQELTRMMAESVNDVATVQRGLQRTLQSSEDELAAQARLTRDLQDDLLRTRMVEFESLADRLYRVVRQAAKETGKSVRLDMLGGAIEVDRGVLERMVGPFEHLLRNSVAHGIEAAAARRAAGKDDTGTITISAQQEANEIAVEVRDDGAGLDLARIRQRAVERGLIAADAVLDDEQLRELIFVPGFSTAEAVSGLAGRGVGMDVVRAEVTAMGGRIETRSEPGQGSVFRLLLPLTTAVTQVVMLRFGERRVAVPSTLVEVVRRAKPDEVERCYASGEYVFDGHPVPFYWLGALMQDDARSAAPQRTQIILVLRSAAQRVAVHVDEVLGNQEVVVKNLGPQLARLPGLAGITLLPSGAVATIYNPVALANVYGDEARRRMQARPEVVTPAEPVLIAPQAPLVLVVDDSLTVRRVTQRLLAREGYRVTLAKDGLEAIEKLAGERPAVLLSDIEMPRMDGFDLVRNVRADPRLEGLPVIMITSRIAQKHRDYAAELGVDHYLGKPYAEDELLALVARHAGADIAL